MDIKALAKNRWIDLLKRSFDDWMDDNAPRLSAALAYYSIFSIAPLLVITIGLAGLFFGHEAASGQLYGELKGYVGAQAAEALQSMVRSAAKPAQGVWATVMGFLTLMLGASGVFGQLKDALNIIWKVRQKQGADIMDFLQGKLLNFGMVLVIGFLLLVSLLLSTALAALNKFFEHAFTLPTVVWSALAFAISLGMATTLFAMIFKVLPDARIRWRDVWVGALITGLLFEVGKTALGWYLGRESTASAYGAAGSVVLLLLWVYYTSCILFFGAEFTRVHSSSVGRVIRPSANAEPLTAEELARQGMGSASRPAEDKTPAPRSESVPHGSFLQRLMAPILKYLEGRGTLLAIEAREALRQIILLVVILAVGVVAIFAGWLLLVTALVGWLTSYAGWSWVMAVAVTGGAHVLTALAAAFIMWMRLGKARWFSDTLNELKKDRTWLLNKTRRN